MHVERQQFLSGSGYIIEFDLYSGGDAWVSWLDRDYGVSFVSNVVVPQMWDVLVQSAYGREWLGMVPWILI